MPAFSLLGYAGLEWLPLLLVILGAGHLVGILSLICLLFPRRFEIGRALASIACGCGIFDALICSMVFERCTLVGFLFAASPLLEGIASMIYLPKRFGEARGFEVMQSQVIDDPTASIKGNDTESAKERT